MKKMTAMFLSLMMLLGILAPAYAVDADASADTASASVTQEVTVQDTEEPGEPACEELSTEQLFTTVTLLMRLRQILPVEERLDNIIKSVGELKANEKTVQLESNDMLAISFYTIEHGGTLNYDETAKAIICSWDYTNEAGDLLRMSVNTNTASWDLYVRMTTSNNTTLTKSVTVK